MSSAVEETLLGLRFANIIGGKQKPGKETHQVVNPRTEENLWDVSIASEQDLDDAVKAGLEAFKTWKLSTNAERRDALFAVSKVVSDNASLLAAILMKETGKSQVMADGEVFVTALDYQYFAGVQPEDELQYEDDTIRIMATHEPYGVIGAISPWNYPLVLSTNKIASALATGNCVIIKPSPYTPYTITKLCELAQAVLPPGVFQVLNGGADIGELITLHPDIPHISFTGTIGVGRRILENGTRMWKKVILEGAGNDASIITDDVDLEDTAAKIAEGCLLHAGQVCVAPKRLYVHENIYDRFLDLLKEEAKKFAIVEDPSAPSTFSPLSNKANYDRCRGIMEDCKKNGFNIVVGGEIETTSKGYWLSPMIVSRPPEDSRLVVEEQFGPVIPVMSWSDEEDVIARANRDDAGLGAAIWCRDINRAERIAKKLESGSVWINKNEMPHFAAWFAGRKLSGFGGELGRRGLLSYCQIKSIHYGK